ncbi:hypothetical protein [Flavobacterium ardleyense]|uniref:hypothetical protein n=1 Tax=Flavobacterium ardleyense TaxID=2038737 RepID=UPI00298CE346|nr:hypothetical protein [Flavobacterium ardleyense]
MQQIDLKAPRWFWAIAILLFLWNLIGLSSFIIHTFISDDELQKLAADERALYSEYPFWVVLLFATAVAGGLLASLGILFRKKWSQIAAVISLMAVVPQMIHNVCFTSSIQVYGLAQAVAMPIIVVIFALILVWFAGFATKRNWLK